MLPASDNETNTVNATLRKFGYPASLIREYTSWVVMIRPKQITLGCAIIAAKSACASLGGLTPREAAELPEVIRDFEAAVKNTAEAVKFNYLALMMVDPNPHFHAIPRYAEPVTLDGQVFIDASFPNAPDLHSVHELDSAELQRLKARLMAGWLAP